MTHVVTDEVELKSLVEQLYDRGEFAFDVETIGTDPETQADLRLDPRRNSVVWVAFASSGGLSFALPVGHPVGKQVGTKKEPRTDRNGTVKQFKVPDWGPPPPQIPRDVAMGILEPLFFSDVEKTGHNVKFDLESMQKYFGDVVIPGPYFDTMVASHLLNENWRDQRLAALVKREFGFQWNKRIGERIERHAFADAARYVHTDTKYTWLLRRRFAPLLQQQQLDGVWRLEMDVLEVLLHMERTGALIDVDVAQTLMTELERELNRLRGALYRHAGREVNLNSTPQLQRLLFGPKKEQGFGLRSTLKTPKGAPSTARAALENLDHPFVTDYLKLQEVDKIHATYLKAYLGGETIRTVSGKTKVEVKPSILVEGKVHPNFRQAGTVTGRFSCSEPNLQNIPRPDSELGKQVRGLFIAPPGHRLVVADYSQIEYVVMAHFSRDPVLVKAFREGVDLHALVASMVFGIPVEDVTKVQRTTAKNTNFAVAYGAGTEKVAAMSKISVAEAERFRARHRKMLPKLYRWTDTVVATCRRTRPPHVKTLMGRKRRLPTIHSQNWGQRAEAERQAVNSVVQGSAADIIKLAMVRLHALCDEELRLSLSVHDELVLVVPDDRVEDGVAVMREAMLGEGIQVLMTVPMNIDLKVVDRWSEAK